MHLYVIARGHADWMDRWKNNLMAQFLPHPVTINGKKYGDNYTQLVVRPVELLEIVFPRKSLNKVLNMVCGPHEIYKQYGLNYPWHKLGLNGLRMALRLNKVEPWENCPVPVMPPHVNHVGVHIIGTKDDKDNPETGDEML
jgi:hypothetical protein